MNNKWRSLREPREMLKLLGIEGHRAGIETLEYFKANVGVGVIGNDDASQGIRLNSSLQFRW